ncbi:YheC/YheD family protein [Bacillus sp. MRMR6]|uniref:YheC/YheD family protein n=1 Tax=Bacillus sp. MRMR6 TaxID=1928617 RepID=UPI000951D5E6|nr:YheC/YheD family protein [Bacillus sp. MRMR6]OLS33722.1 hypothetical protein BTR25_24500 [Bacillus sp. MRMR6]
MKASTGRLGQYKILKQNKSISNYLLRRELLTEYSLHSYLDEYQSVVIQPVFGPEKIHIYSYKGRFKVGTNSTSDTMLDKEEIYHYLLKTQLKQKYYIIQQGISSLTSPSPFSFYISVYRPTPLAEWLIQGKTAVEQSFLNNISYTYFRSTIEDLILLTAAELGTSYPNCHCIVFEISCDLQGEIWIHDTILHYSNSKWSQYQIFSKSDEISSYVPKTDLCTKHTFKEYLLKYHEVIVKPCVGKEGIGIVKVSLINSSICEIHTGRRKWKKSSINEAYQFIEKNYLNKRYYLIQEKVSLALINYCPFDVRVIVQKIHSSWTVMAKIVKVAHEGYFITNVAQKLYFLEDALHESSISYLEPRQIEEKINTCCMNAVKHLEENIPSIDIVGFDIGISGKGEIWIIEGNYNPNLSMFYRLENNQIFWDIQNAKLSAKPPSNLSSNNLEIPDQFD